MVKLLRTVLNLGLKAPVKVLHITDTHITESDREDDVRIQELIEMRRMTFIEEGGYAPRKPQEYLEEALELAEKENALPVLTGDIQDLNTSGNRKILQKILSARDFLYTPGTHEFQRSSCTPYCCPLEEPLGYYANTRNQLIKEFSPWAKWDFDNCILNGLNLITVDNSQDYFPEITFQRLKQEVEKGLPILLFMHVPVTCPALLRGPYAESSLTEEQFQISMETLEYIRTNPLIKASFAGHLHCEKEEVLPSGHKIHVTPGTYAGICRMIEIR
ncbi:MAG: metallophosphoesterase [Ruminococcaceae bacterium]|nr:metallophosphoesterase [Oscillospiraceae bacterium]